MSNKTTHIRVSFQFTVTMDDETLQLTSDKVSEQYYIERQKRLFQAIISDPERLTAFLRYQIASDFEGRSWQDWDELIMDNEDGDASEVLAPAIATLPKRDQDSFRKAKEKGLFFENVEDVVDCFSTRLEGASFEVVEARDDAE